MMINLYKMQLLEMFKLKEKETRLVRFLGDLSSGFHFIFSSETNSHSGVSAS